MDRHVGADLQPAGRPVPCGSQAAPCRLAKQVVRAPPAGQIQRSTSTHPPWRRRARTASRRMALGCVFPREGAGNRGFRGVTRVNFGLPKRGFPGAAPSGRGICGKLSGKPTESTVTNSEHFQGDLSGFTQRPSARRGCGRMVAVPGGVVAKSGGCRGGALHWDPTVSEEGPWPASVVAEG